VSSLTWWWDSIEISPPKEIRSERSLAGWMVTASVILASNFLALGKQIAVVVRDAA
jgi:hypothetical protein